MTIKVHAVVQHSSNLDDTVGQSEQQEVPWLADTAHQRADTEPAMPEVIRECSLSNLLSPGDADAFGVFGHVENRLSQQRLVA